MVYRNKTYICFDGDTDIHYYRLMRAWKQNEGIKFEFFDAHDLNTAKDSSQESSIKRQLRERLKNSVVLVVLIGKNTRNLYRFVRWEMEQAIEMSMPIIGVNLNNRREMDNNYCPPIIRDELAVYVSFNSAILQHALENWPNSHAQYKRKGESGPFHYKNEIYNSLGL